MFIYFQNINIIFAAINPMMSHSRHLMWLQSIWFRKGTTGDSLTAANMHVYICVSMPFGTLHDRMLNLHHGPFRHTIPSHTLLVRADLLRRINDLNRCLVHSLMTHGVYGISIPHHYELHQMCENDQVYITFTCICTSCKMHVAWKLNSNLHDPTS